MCVHIHTAHTQKQHECATTQTNIQKGLCIQFINCSYRAVPTLRLHHCTTSRHVDHHLQCEIIQPYAQHDPAWLSMAQQGLAALPGSKGKQPLHEYTDKLSCNSGFRFCTTGGYQWGTELCQCFYPPATLVVHLNFEPIEIFKIAGLSCFEVFPQLK